MAQAYELPDDLAAQLRRNGLTVREGGRLGCVLCGGVFVDLLVGGGRMPDVPLNVVRFIHHWSRQCRREQRLRRRAARRAS